MKQFLRASELIDIEHMDDESRRQIKISNETKALHVILENKGRSDEKIDIAKEMIQENFTKAQISKITKLTIETIEKLINELKKSP